MTKDKLIRKIVDTVFEEAKERIGDLVAIGFRDWDKKELERIIEEE